MPPKAKAQRTEHSSSNAAEGGAPSASSSSSPLSEVTLLPSDNPTGSTVPTLSAPSASGNHTAPLIDSLSADDATHDERMSRPSPSTRDGATDRLVDTSVNAIFAVTGPRAGVLDHQTAANALLGLVDLVDDGVYLSVAEAWDGVAVPANQYWRRRVDVSGLSLQRGVVPTTALQGSTGGGQMGREAVLPLPPPRAPDPRRLGESFYGSRVEAMSSLAYATNGAKLVLAVDRTNGSGSKLFTVLNRYAEPSAAALQHKRAHSSSPHRAAPDEVGGGEEMGVSAVSSDEEGERPTAHGNSGETAPCLPCPPLLPPDSAVADFIATIPHRYRRNLYVLVDESAAVDPFFDIDCAFDGDGVGHDADVFVEVFPPHHSSQEASRRRPSVEGGGGASAEGPSVRAATMHPVTGAQVEEVLFDVISFLADRIESQLHTKVSECLVLTSSVQVQRAPAAMTAALRGPSQPPGRLQQLKLSCHVHFRLHQQQAFASIRELHLFMATLREELDATLAAAAATATAAEVPPTVRRARRVRRCVDFGVYSRWRAMRLPYCVKCPLQSGDSAGSASSNATTAVNAFSAADAAADDLLTSQLRQLGLSIPSVEVGSVAEHLLHNIVLSSSSSEYAAQSSLLQKLLFLFRFLLPIVPGVTQLSHADLRSFLESHAPHVTADGAALVGLSSASAPSNTLRRTFGSAVVDFACIQRDTADSGTTLPPRRGARSRLLVPSDSLLTFTVVQPSHGGPAGVAGERDEGRVTDARRAVTDDPFGQSMPPFPHSARVEVQDPLVKRLCAEVFACLSPLYGTSSASPSPPPSAGVLVLGQSSPSSASSEVLPIAPDRLRVYYVDSIRAYYVLQKQSKYCLRLNRVHRSTYAQLYLTYGSVKVRCYANDCSHGCLFVHWAVPSAASSSRGTWRDRGLPAVEGYPKYDHLTRLRDRLFPPLPYSELVRRYGVEALQRQPPSTSMPAPGGRTVSVGSGGGGSVVSSAAVV